MHSIDSARGLNYLRMRAHINICEIANTAVYDPVYETETCLGILWVRCSVYSGFKVCSYKPLARSITYPQYFAKTVII